MAANRTLTSRVSPSVNRRIFLAAAGAAAWSMSMGTYGASAAEGSGLFEISLAQWSLHRTIFGGKLDNRDFAKAAKEDYGIHAIEYVNQFFFDKAKDQSYLGEMKKRAEGEGVKSLLIMCDREGNLGDPNADKRTKAVENHYKWIEAAKFLGCHSIRVNAASSGSYEEQVKLAADGLRRLSEFGDQHGLNVIVENHGGLSSDGSWLAGVIKSVNAPELGTLPDFGNWRDEQGVLHDPVKNVGLVAPFAKGCSAKGCSMDGLCGVKKRGPVSVMYMQSSRRMPNSPGMAMVGSLLNTMPGAMGVRLPLTR